MSDQIEPEIQQVWTTLSKALICAILYFCIYLNKYVMQTKKYLQLRRAIDEKREVRLSAKEFFSPAVLKPNIICIALMFFQQMSGESLEIFIGINKVPCVFKNFITCCNFFYFIGINAVIFYTVEIFNSSGSNIDPNFSAVIVGLVLMISVIISILLIDRAGRKVLLVVSDVGMCVALFGLGLFFYFKEQGHDELVDSLNWLPLASLMLFVTAFNFG